MSIVRNEQVALPYLKTPASWAMMGNGQQIFIIPKPGEVVHLHTVVRTGSVNETDRNTGISHFLEHLLFKGTERFPAGAFDRILEGLGARVNAATSKDFTQYYITVPQGKHGEHFRLALDLHADMLLNALLPEEEIGPPFDPSAPDVAEKRERMVVIEEIKMGRDNPWRNAVQQLTELLYPHHPYRREIIGTAEVIARIPRDEIETYYRTWYQPANMVTIIAGDIDPLATIDEVERAFAVDASLPVEHPVFQYDEPEGMPKVTHQSMPLNVAYEVLAYLGPPSNDLKTEIALDALSLILGEGKSSRVQLHLLEQLADTPFIEAGSSHWAYRDSSMMMCFGISQPSAGEQCYELLCREVEMLHTEPPTVDELDKAITRLETSFAASAETSAGIAGAIADSMARLNNPSHYIEYLPLLRNLTRDDLTDTAARYLRSDRLCAVTIAPEEG